MLPTSVLAPPAPAWAHGEAYAEHFDRLARSEPGAAAARRLLVHIDADLDDAELLALWQALWRCVHGLDAGERAALAGALDGRHAAPLQALGAEWAAPALVQAVAEHMLPRRPAFVAVLLAHHGLDPLSEPAAHPARLVMLAARAALAAAPARLDEAAIEALRGAVLDATGRAPALLARAMAVLFDLALHARDEDTACEALAQLLLAGRADLLAAARVREWLDGSAFVDAPAARHPLTLAAPWQGRWLRPAAWREAGERGALMQALHREAPRARLAALGVHLGAQGWLDGAAEAPLPPALQRLSALDAGYALLERGGDPLPALQPILDNATLAPPAQAALHRGAAALLAAAGDLEGRILALARARRAQADPALRHELCEALQALGGLPALPAFGADWREEEPFWKTALLDGQPALQRVAAHHLASLWTHGHLEPRPPLKCRQLEPARALWQRLRPHRAHAADARAALEGAELSVMLPAQRRSVGTDHLWFDTPGAAALTIVFSCAQSHHGYPEVMALRGRLPGQHLMFVRNPAFNWYSDEAFDALAALVRREVLPRFAPERVTCHYGSMGGTGALKIALEFGFRAIVFNPQTDLDLWAAFRARDRARLWAAQRHAQLAHWPAAAWERVPLYLACGSASADREALAVVIGRLRECRHASAVIEKFADPNHSGLMNRISTRPLAAMLTGIGCRLDLLAAAAPAAGARLVAEDQVAAFWERLDAAPATKVEIQVRAGRLWWQDSRSCATR